MWLRVIIIVTVLLSIPVAVLADTTADVTVTARGFILESPTLTITWISDTEIKLDWTVDDDTANVTIRAKIGSVPDDRSDGYLVYTGNATTYTDTSLNLDEMATYMYYRIWAQDDEGVWEEEGDYGWIGGEGMVLIAIILLCGIATYFSLRTSNILMALGAATTWLFLLVYTRDNPIGGVDTGSFADELTVYMCWIFAILVVLIAIGRGRRERRYFSGGGSVEWGESRKLEPTQSPPSSRYSDMDNTEYRNRVNRALRRRRR